jgi:two-component system cell cycle sensor histidine kinase/response regulator CckA
METRSVAPADVEPQPFQNFPRPVRLVLPYAISLASVIFPVGITAALAHHQQFRPFMSFAFVLDVAAVTWWWGFWAGILATAASIPALTLALTGGRLLLPHKLDPYPMAVMILIVLLASRVSAWQRRVRAMLRAANRQLDERVKERTTELNEARESLRTTLASIGDAVIATGNDGRITILNGVAESLTGWSAAEAAGRHLDDVFVIRNADTRLTVESPVSKVLRAGMAVGLANHTLLIGRNGTEIPIDDAGAPIRSADGAVTGVVLTFRDISERYRAEAERKKLQEADERLVGVLTNINDGFLTVDREWRLTFLNRKACDLMQRPGDELLQTTLWQALPGLEGTQGDTDLRRAMRENVPVRCVFPYDPLHAWFDLGAYPSRDGLALMVRDITETQRLEAQLRQAQKMEAVGRLAGGIAHDFNNLLTVINGYAEFALQDLPKDLALCDSIKEILNAGRRAAELTNGLLAFSRKQVRQPSVLRLNDSVRGTEKMLRRLVGEDIEISTSLANDIWEIEADKSQLEQIVVNLAVNARDAMPKGGLLMLETRNVELDAESSQRLNVPAADYAMLAVSDNGQGMDAITQSRIFEPFFTTKGPGKGTGLGLSTVYGIVTQSGGAISVYSEPEQGTTFKLFFPRRKEAAASGVAETLEEVVAPARGRRQTILLVEDEQSVRRLTRTMLERHGFRVLEAGGGQEALALCRTENGAVDLVLTDMVMPQMSGDQVAAALRQEYPHLNFLFMSGYTEHAVVSKALLAPDVSFVSKPFTAAVLLGKVNQLLSGAAAKASGGAA